MEASSLKSFFSLSLRSAGAADQANVFVAVRFAFEFRHAVAAQAHKRLFCVPAGMVIATSPLIVGTLTSPPSTRS